MIWTILYWVLLTLAALSALYALLWDRPGWRGRPQLRCRKCWYDLTAAPGDLKVEPIQCPECGKKHHSARSMRKTKRSKKWIAIACILWLTAYAAHVTPSVQKNGWGASIPRTALVASFPFLSERQGTGLPNVLGVVRVSIKPTKLDQLVQDQISYYSWGTSFQAHNDHYNWFARRLVFLLARLEPDSLLTDGTTAKGLAYKSLITRFILNDQVYDFEKRWARSIVHIEFDIDQEFGPDELIQANFKVRRLLLRRYHLSCGRYGQLSYQCSAPSGFSLNGIQPVHTTQAEADQYWIQRLLWDNLFQTNGARGRTSWDFKPTLARGTQVTPLSGEARISMGIMEAEDYAADQPNRNTIHRINQTIHYTIDPSRVMVPDSSDETLDHIQNQFKAKLTVVYDSQQQRWVPVVQLISSASKDCAEDSVLFGGMVSVRAIRKDFPDTHGQEILRSDHDRTWWRLGWKEVEPPNLDPSKLEGISEQDRIRIFNPKPRCDLTARPEQSTFLPGEIKPTNYFPSGMKDDYTLIVRIQPLQGNAQYSYGGLWADRIYTGNLDFQLDKWTLVELKRYVVNGNVPDHAMP
jgi:hypothetical protein